ncbi:MAG: extracellular solute-binding protein, partial [Anaerolineae bacterium]|nr:extracellular solute-binding protein [Anaerolineae bacterium]
MGRWFLVVSLLVGLASGCGGGTTPTAAPPPTSAPEEESPQATAPTDETPEEVTTITWWTEPILKSNREAFLTHIVDSFNAAHPDIVLEVLFIADLDRVTRTAVQGGEGPDIVQSPGPAFVMDYVEAGHVLPLDDYAEEYGWAEAI